MTYDKTDAMRDLRHVTRNADSPAECDEFNRLAAYIDRLTTPATPGGVLEAAASDDFAIVLGSIGHEEASDALYRLMDRFSTLTAQVERLERVRDVALATCSECPVREPLSLCMGATCSFQPIRRAALDAQEVSDQ